MLFFPQYTACKDNQRLNKSYSQQLQNYYTECNLLNLLYCVLLTAHFQSQPTSVSFLPLKLQH